MRLIAQALGVSLLLSQASAYALSIGNMRVKSALGNSFNAEITLNLNASDDPNDIHVQLAPFDKFSERGIPWSQDVLKLRFNTTARNNQSIIIRVKTAGLITEPALMFLLQVRSPKGTSYRQFTALIDLPEHSSYRPLVLHNDPMDSMADYAPAPRYKTPERRYTRSTRVMPVQHPRKYPPPPGRYTAPKNTPKTKLSVPSPLKYDGWVNVKRNDSLSKIAMRLANQSNTWEQVAIALYNSNPNAFYSPNINALKAGQTLKIPSADQVQQLSAETAKTEFARQNQSWQDGTPIVKLSEPVKPVEQAVATPPPSPIIHERKLVLSAPNDTWLTDNSVLSDLNNKGDFTANMSALNVQVHDLQARLAKMEQQLHEMNNTLKIKDQQLTELQGREAVKANGGLLMSAKDIAKWFYQQRQYLPFIIGGLLPIFAWWGWQAHQIKKATAELKRRSRMRY